MGKATGFKEYPRVDVGYHDAKRRLTTWDEIGIAGDVETLRQQGARCMDCGVPFCQSETGCPLDNRIPEWNDLVYRDDWREAFERLHATNNFPEVTGRVCPAPCEGACVLGIHEPPVAIKSIEQAIIDRGFAEGWVVPQPPPTETQRSVGIVGSGPAGLAAAQQLRRAGHCVTVYERADRIGGLMVYGIPNMKLAKTLLEQRFAQLRAEGVEMRTGVTIGSDLSLSDLRAKHDAVLVATGATQPRDLPVEGRDLSGIHFAMDYLSEATRAVLANEPESAAIHARDKHVVVIGGGDTGTDCIATALRQGCASLTAFEILEQSPDERAEDNPWPQWPRIHRVDYGHAEAMVLHGRDPREFAVMTERFTGDETLTGLQTVRVRRAADGGFEPIDSSQQTFRADLVLLAMGFTGPDRTLEGTALARDERTNIRASVQRFHTSEEGIFAAGDCRRGQSLVVWAIAEGRAAARSIDEWLMGESVLAAPALAAR